MVARGRITTKHGSFQSCTVGGTNLHLQLTHGSFGPHNFALK